MRDGDVPASCERLSEAMGVVGWEAASLPAVRLLEPEVPVVEVLAVDVLRALAVPGSSPAAVAAAVGVDETALLERLEGFGWPRREVLSARADGIEAAARGQSPRVAADMSTWRLPRARREIPPVLAAALVDLARAEAALEAARERVRKVEEDLLGAAAAAERVQQLVRALAAAQEAAATCPWPSLTGEQLASVRAWARSSGRRLPRAGDVPDELVSGWLAAGAPPAAGAPG